MWAVLLLLALAVASPVPFKNCGTPQDHLKVNSVDVTPWPPVPGKNATGSLSVTLDEVVSGGTVEVHVKFYGAEIYHNTFDICTMYPEELKCPVQPGSFAQTLTAALPTKVPHGIYELNAKGKDQNGAELFCFILPVTIKAQPAITQEMVTAINEAHVGWTAGMNAKFSHMTRAEAAALMGVLEGGPQLPVKNPENVNAPDSYDVRNQWGATCPVVKDVWDQGPCGSCWAFGGAASISDRVCISSNGKVQLHVAAGDPVSCCDDCGDGCEGGYPSALWSYWKSTGIVTGWTKESNEGCLPYYFNKCDHHTTGKYQPCPAVQPTPDCPNKCNTGYAKSWAADKQFGASAYSLRGEEALKSEIFAHGPVEVAFSVYEDFLTYKSGVYHHVSGSYLGGHAVSMIGYGTDTTGTKYWIIKNSWNEDWGDQGYFKILRGKNECGIESSAVAGIPKL